MPKKRPTEVGWDSDEDMLLADTGTLSLFTKKFGNDEEVIDEDALLGISDDKSKSTQHKSAPGESFELFIDEKEMTFDETADSQELDYEDTYQEEEIAQEFVGHEPDPLVVSGIPNQTVAKIQPIKATVFGAKTGESDSESDEEKKSRGRFKTERQTITLKTPLFTKAAAIPDSLELTKEMEAEIESFNMKQGKKWKKNQKNVPQKFQQQQQLNEKKQHQVANNIRPVRPMQQQHQFQRGPRPQGNNPRQGGPRFNRPRHFNPRGPQQHFNHPRPIEPINNGNFRPPMQPNQERGPAPLFHHEAMEMQINPHSSPGPQSHPPPPHFEQPPHPQQIPQGQVEPFNHGHPPGPGQPQVPFSPPPPQHPSPAVHVNPNFTGPIPQEAFSYQRQPQQFPPNPQPGPPYPVTSQPGPRPQHFQQPGMPPHSVHQQPGPQQYNPPQQHFHPQQQGYPPRGPPNSTPQMNYPPHQGPPQRPPQQPRPMDMPRPGLLDSPGPRPGFVPQPRPGVHNNRPGQPRPIFQSGPRPQIPQQQHQQQQMMRGPPPRPNQQQPPHRAPHPVGQQIPPRFQGQGQGPPRHPNQPIRPQRFQNPNVRPQGPPGVALQQPGGFNPTPDQFAPVQSEEERRKEEQEQLQKMREMEEKKRKRAERFSKNEPVEVATTSGNLKVIKTTTKIGQKRPTTSTVTEISPAKIIKMETGALVSGADADLESKLQKQKMIRERIQRQKEARRQAEAESRRQKLSEKLASEGASLEEFEKKETQQTKIEKIQGQIKEQQDYYKQLKLQKQQQNVNTMNRQQPTGIKVQKVQGQPGVGRGHVIQGQQPHVGRGRGKVMSGQNVGQLQKGRHQGGHFQQNPNVNMKAQQPGPGNRLVIAQGSKVTGVNSMGAASQGQMGGRMVKNTDDQKRTVLPGGTPQRRIVLESQHCTVSIEGLSSKPDLGKINGLCASVGTVENFNYKAEERRVLVRFADQLQANKFINKYNRYMLDLTHIKVRLVPNV